MSVVSSRRVVVVGGSVLALVVGGVGVATLGQSSGTSAPALSLPAATSLARSAIANVMARVVATGPTNLSFVQSTRQDANNVVDPGTSVGSNQPVVVVLLTGSFKYTNTRVPPGTAAPSGTAVTFVVDDTTAGITDLGVTNTSPDLEALGSVQTLPTIPS